ncbi:MAG TPA: TolC family protein [Candidatus Cloacimonadota bacterium]|nr:TolC family protein [Candidatus Cloacimonadota bacterium]
MKRPLLLITMIALGLSLSAISLEESLQMAKSNNKTLLMAKEDVFKADETYKDVRGNLLPQLSLQGAYSLSKTYLPDSAVPSFGSISSYLDDTTASDNDYILAGAMDAMISSMIPSSPKNEGSLALQLKMDQVLFLGGKLINGIKAVDRFRSVQKLRYSLTEEQIILETTKLFYQTILAGKLAEIQAEGLKTAQRHLNRVEVFNQEGQVSEFDLLRARLEVAKLQPELLAAQNQYELALAAFRKQIGTDDPDVVPDGEFVLPESFKISLEDALAAGKKNRTELELVDISTQIMQIKYNAEKGNYLPNVALSADYSLYTAADELAIQRDDFGSRFSVGIGFQIPLFTGLSNTSKRNYAKHDLIQAKLQQRDAEELIELQIKQNHQKLEHAWQNYEVQQQNIRLAERSLELAQVRYENQVGIQLEVFDAQIMLSAIKLQYFNAIFEVIAAERDFQKSIGNPL